MFSSPIGNNNTNNSNNTNNINNSNSNGNNSNNPNNTPTQQGDSHSLPVEAAPTNDISSSVPLNASSANAGINDNDVMGKRKRESSTIEGDDLFSIKRAKFDAQEDMDMDKDSGEEDTSSSKLVTEKKLNELLEPMYRLRSQLESVLVKLPKPPARSSQISGEVWGKLYPQFPGQSPVSLKDIVFTIGRSPRCNLAIKDPVVNGVLCRLHFVQGKAFIESMSSSGILSLNHRIMRKQVKLHLRDGDEISITGNQTYSYIFNQIKTATPGSDIDVMDSLSPTTKPLKLSSSFSRTSYRPLINQMITDTKSIEKLTSSLNISSVPMFMDDPQLSENNDLSTHSTVPMPTILEISDVEKSPEKSDTENTPTEKGTEYKAQLMQKIESLFISPEDINVTFDQFPYYIDENVKNMLINAAYIYLEKPQYTKFTKSLPTLSRRILLSGQKGTQFLQEKLVQALAKHFRAKLLVLDDCFQENQKPDYSDFSPSTLSIR